jgi:hypothetical protein
MSTLRVTTLQNSGGTKSVPLDTVVDGSAKAWVTFNGTGTVAIRAQFNVSSITDDGVGNFVINFTNAMTDASYAITSTGSGDSSPSGGAWGDVSLRNFAGGSVPTTTGVRISHLGTTSVGYTDPVYCSVVIHR